MSFQADYTERVYAGVLGKLIGVYLGRPFEGWSYEAIMENLGEINYYVHEKLDVPLVVTDDDVSGTFTFLRAMQDYGYSKELTPAQIGQTWLNYLIEERTILWWGGMGNSTEHTAYMRLKNGIQAPLSGSIEMNGKVVAEQIGSQIFIDGWAMIAPGDPALAADFARRAGSVSHDGEAIYGAQVLAAMEAQAFVESDLNKLLDTAVTFIPSDSVIYRMISDIREWHQQEPDWRKARELIEANYGYDKYGGNCHMVPNHGLIVHSLLYGEDDFQKSLMIVNTSGWDTDCNSGNVGCLLGIKNGLASIDDNGPDWRGPVADKLYLPTADGGRAVSDAVAETYHVVNCARALVGEAPIAPKNGAHFHFELSGSTQGFEAEESTEVRGTVSTENVVGHSITGERSLALHYRHIAQGRSARVATPTFTPSKEVAEYFNKRGYALHASPRLYPGQTVTASVQADSANSGPVQCCLYVNVYGKLDALEIRRSIQVELAPGASHTFSWQLEDMGGAPIASVGVEVSSPIRANGTIYLDSLTWDGTPNVEFKKPDFANEDMRKRFGGGATTDMWRMAWVDGVDSYAYWWPEAYRIVQNEGRGLLMQGTREWTDYQVSSTMTPHLAKASGVAVRVQGMRRYYALLLCDDQKARLVKALDGDTVLAEVDFAWELGTAYDFNLQVEGNRLKGGINGQSLFAVEDNEKTLDGGGIALVCEEGRTATESVSVKPV